METDLIARIGANGSLDLATVDDVRRAVRRSTSTASRSTTASPGRRAPSDTWATHPLLERLAAGGMQPPDAGGVPRNEIRELVRRGLVVEREGICFHHSAIDAAGAMRRRRCCRRHPDGFTTSQFREAAGTTRKYAVPLLTELDARGVTRRRGDLRVPGPRLPSPGGPSAT